VLIFLSNKKSKAQQIVDAYRNEGKTKKDKKNLPADTQGSYTGVTKDGTKPVQDADDL